MVDVADPARLADEGADEDTELEEPEHPDRGLGGGDPRQAIVEWIHRRLDDRLAPVEAEGTPYHGVYVLTRRDLEEVLQDQLPPESETTASITTPGEVYVDALCPVCRIATEIVQDVEVVLITHGNGSSELKLKTASKSKPHQHGQLRTRDHVAPGQVAAPFGDGDVPRETDEESAALDAFADAVIDATVADVNAGALGPNVTASRVGHHGADLDLGACPWPGCALAAEHTGAHSVPSQSGDVPTDDDLDLLPF